MQREQAGQVFYGKQISVEIAGDPPYPPRPPLSVCLPHFCFHYFFARAHGGWVLTSYLISHKQYNDWEKSNINYTRWKEEKTAVRKRKALNQRSWLSSHKLLHGDQISSVRFSQSASLKSSSTYKSPISGWSKIILGCTCEGDVDLICADEYCGDDRGDDDCGGLPPGASL